MEDPFLLKPPSNPIDRIHALARDLAYGVVTGLFSMPFVTNDLDEIFTLRKQKEFEETVLEKWGNIYELFKLLTTFGYLESRNAGY